MEPYRPPGCEENMGALFFLIEYSTCTTDEQRERSVKYEYDCRKWIKWRREKNNTEKIENNLKQ